MQCDYCGKQMPESYSYEVGGVVECSKCFKKRNMTIEDELRQHIIEVNKRSIAIEESLRTRLDRLQEAYDDLLRKSQKELDND